MELIIDEGKTLVISVDDAHAAYPVTVHHLFFQVLPESHHGKSHLCSDLLILSH